MSMQGPDDFNALDHFKAREKARAVVLALAFILVAAMICGCMMYSILHFSEWFNGLSPIACFWLGVASPITLGAFVVFLVIKSTKAKP